LAALIDADSSFGKGVRLRCGRHYPGKGPQPEAMVLSEASALAMETPSSPAYTTVAKKRRVLKLSLKSQPALRVILTGTQMASALLT